MICSSLIHWAVDLAIDFSFGLDTRGARTAATLGTNPAIHHPHVAVDWLSLPLVLWRMGVSSSDVFLDLGCGKGRALLIAGRFPFARLVGVELSAELARIAGRNLVGLGSRAQIEIGDARDFSIPDDATLVFLHNPFGAEVLDEVLDRLRASAEMRPRQLRVLCRGRVSEEKFLAAGLEPEPLSPRRYRGRYALYRFVAGVSFHTGKR